MSGEVTEDLKEAVLDSLAKALSADQDTRRVAEERIKAFEVIEDFGVYLVEIVLDEHIVTHVRQLACIVLKQYISNHWYAKQCEPLVTDRAKQNIKRLLPLGLALKNKILRNAVAAGISSVAYWEWPDNWPDLMSIMVGNLRSGNPRLLQGTLYVVEELVSEVPYAHLPALATTLLGEFYTLLDNPTCSFKIKTHTVKIFTSLITNTSPLKNIPKDVITSFLSNYTNIFVSALQTSDEDHDNWPLKTEVLRSLTLLVYSLPKCSHSFIEQILPTIWQSVLHSGNFYASWLLNGPRQVEEMDSEDEIQNYSFLIIKMLDLIQTMVESRRFTPQVTEVLPDIFYYTLVFIQISAEMEVTWNDDMSKYVEDEMHESFENSIRINAHSLLILFIDEFRDDVMVPALCRALQMHTTEAETAKNAGHRHWWKPHESCMYALGTLKDTLTAQIHEGKLQFDMMRYIQNWMSLLDHPEYPYLLGRLLWLGAHYAELLQPQTFQIFFRATVCHLQNNTTSHVLKICALRALIVFFRMTPGNPNCRLINEMLPAVVDGILPLFFQYNEKPLMLLIEVLISAISMDQCFAASLESKVVPLTINLFLKYSNDQSLVQPIHTLIKKLCQNDGCRGPLMQKLFPTLISILNSSSEKASSSLQAFTLEVLTTVLKFSCQVVNAEIVSITFPAVVNFLLTTDDQSVLHNGTDCLRCFMHVFSEYIFSFSDSEGKNGLLYVLNLIYHLLEPSFLDEAVANVGRLVISLMKKAGSLVAPHIDALLKATLSKMQVTDSLKAMQSLLAIFTYLFYTQIDAALNFLTTVPGPMGTSALEFVLNEWFSKQHLFCKTYERRLGILSLCKLLEYGTTSKDKRLEEILVPVSPHYGRLIDKLDSSEERDSLLIPALVKVLKMILYEMAQENAKELRVQNETASDSESCTDTDSSDNDEYYGIEYDPDINDVLYCRDDIYLLDLPTHLVQFLRRFSSDPTFSPFICFLDQKERQTLADATGFRC